MRSSTRIRGTPIVISWGVRDGNNVPVVALGEKRMVCRRRRALVLSTIVLAACALAALVGLNAIPVRVPILGRSLPLRLGIGQGNPHEVKHNTRAPTFVPTEDGTVSSMSW